MKPYLILTLTILITFALQAQEPWIKIPVNTSIELPGNGKRVVQISLPVTLKKGVDSSKVTIPSKRAFLVRQKSRFDLKYKNAFEFVFNPTVPSIEVKIALNAIREAGDYEAIVELRSLPLDPVFIPLTFNRLPATLDTVQTLRIQLKGCDLKKGPLQVRETGGKTNIDTVTIMKPFWRGGLQGDPITIKNPLLEIRAGGILDIPYEVDEELLEDFPLGKTRGKIELTAPEFPGKIIVPIEVTRKKGEWIAYLMLFLGVITGFFVRHVVKDKQELETKRADALELVLKMDKETTGIKDEVFKKSVETLISNLRTATDASGNKFLKFGDRTTTLVKVVATTLTDYDKDRNDYNSRVESASKRLKSLSTLFDKDVLTQCMTSGLSEERKNYAAAYQDLKEGNASGASNKIDGIATALAAFIKDRPASIANFVDLIAKNEVLPEFVPGKIRDLIKGNVRIAQIKIRAAGITADSNLDSQVANIKDIDYSITQLSSVIDFIFDTVNRDVKELNLDEQGKEAAVAKRTFEAWTTEMDYFKINPLARPFNAIITHELNIAVAALKASWITGGGNRASIPDAMPVKELNIAWREKNYFFEGREQNIMQHLKRPIEEEIEAARISNYYYGLAQTIILLILLIAGAGLLYVPNFIGTGSEMISIFLVAFGLDITADNVISIRDKKK